MNLPVAQSIVLTDFLTSLAIVVMVVVLYVAVMGLLIRLKMLNDEIGKFVAVFLTIFFLFLLVLGSLDLYKGYVSWDMDINALVNEYSCEER